MAIQQQLREVENLDGVEYDANKKKTLYAEDINNIISAISEMADRNNGFESDESSGINITSRGNGFNLEALVSSLRLKADGGSGDHVIIDSGEPLELNTPNETAQSSGNGSGTMYSCITGSGLKLYIFNFIEFAGSLTFYFKEPFLFTPLNIVPNPYITTPNLNSDFVTFESDSFEGTLIIMGV